MGSDERAPAWLTGWRRLVLAAGMLVYPALAAAGAISDSRGGQLGTALLIIGLFTLIYAALAIGSSRIPFKWGVVALAMMCAFFLVVLPAAHEQAFWLYAAIAATTVVIAPRATIPVTAIGLVGAIVLPWLWWGGPAVAIAVMMLFTVLVFYAFIELRRTNRELDAERARATELAAEAERLRIARDLHDLLGQSLTAITMKSALARRQAEADGSRSAKEIADVESLSRRALAEVRTAVSGYRTVTLAGELARGRELLRAVGVEAELPASIDVVDERAQELFGWVVREGLTNIARHAHAESCRVEVSAHHVQIDDDGAGSVHPPSNGLRGLAERVEHAGGTLTAGARRGGGWRLRVDLPAAPVGMTS